MADCGAPIQYPGQPKFTCTLPAGHKAPAGNKALHFNAELGKLVRLANRGRADRIGTMTMMRQPTDQYPDGYTDDLAERLLRAAEDLHVREIRDPSAYLGIAIAVSDLVRDLDDALRHGAPWPARWLVHPAEPEAPSDEDRIRDAMAEAQDHPGRVVITCTQHGVASCPCLTAPAGGAASYTGRVVTR